MKQKIRVNWGAKLFSLLFIFSIVPVLVLSVEMVKDIEKKFSEMTLANLGGLAQTKTQVVDQFMIDRVRHVERISKLVAADPIVLVTWEMAKILQSPGNEDIISEKSPDSTIITAEPRPLKTATDSRNKMAMSAQNEALNSNEGTDSTEQLAQQMPASKSNELPEPSDIKVKSPIDAESSLSAETPNDNDKKAVISQPPETIRDVAGKGIDNPTVETTMIEPTPRSSAANNTSKSIETSQVIIPSNASAQSLTPAISKEAQDAKEMLRKSLGLILWDQKEYEELLIIDIEGNVLVSTFDVHEGKSAKNIDYFQKGKGSTYIQNVFISPITEQLTMVVSTPIKDANQRIIGVLAARLNLMTFFRLIGDQVGLGITGETIVARKVESAFVFMAPTRHDADAALNRKIEVGADIFRPLQEAARGQTGTGATVDYRHVAVFAAWQHIPSLDWGLVVKIDQEETFKIVKEMRNTTIFLLVGILLIVLLISALVSKALVAPLKELKVTADKISKGDLDVTLSINSSDEVGDLADSFERMIAAIKFFKEDKNTD